MIRSAIWKPEKTERTILRKHIYSISVRREADLWGAVEGGKKGWGILEIV